MMRFEVDTVRDMIWTPERALDLMPMMNSFTEKFETKDYNAANELLAAIDFENIGVLGIIGIMRATYSARHKLDVWHNRLKDAYVELKSRGEDADHQLRGLL